MKKLLSIVLSLTLVVGLLVGMPAVTKAEDSINVTPADGAQVDLLSDYAYDFCANYERGLVKTLYKKNSNRYYPTPAKFEWDKVSGATSYKLEVSTDANLANPIEINTASNMVEVEDLLPGTEYYYKVSTLVGGATVSSPITHFTTTNLPRTIKVDHAYNTRDVGGCYVNGGQQRVLLGKVIRGARLDQITDEGKAKLLNTYGIKTDLDLRETSKVPAQSPLGDTVNLINISSPQYLGPPSFSNEKGGFDYESAWPVIKSELEVFADANNYPIYVHCNIGRDRTGSIMILIESLLGMTEDEIYRDYELSYFAQVSNSDISDPVAANVKSIDALIDYFKNYSTGTLQENAETYMKQALGMTDAQINAIKSNLLSPLPTPKPSPAPTPIVKKPAKVKIKSAKNIKKKTIVVKYKKASNAKGYQVWWATSKKFKKAKKKFTKKTTYKIKKLKKKKTYYIKVRAYNLNGKAKIYGAYSKVKKVKVKK